MAKSAIDKEFLKKHQFWILLGTFLVLWIVAVVLVKFSATGEKQKAWETAKTAINSAMSKGPKTEAFQKPWNEHGKKFRDHKDVIWKDAWEQQRDMYTWPESMPVTARPLYIDDPFARDASGNINIEADLNNRNRFRTDWYSEQFLGLEQYVSPAEFSGGFFAVFPMQTWDRSAAPTREEIWLAQEDFWVRREMLFMIRNALDSTALFKEIAPPKEQTKETLPEGIVGKKVFRNSSWEITLLFEKSKDGRTLVVSDKSKIKNINPAERTQVLAHPKSNKGLPFRLIQDRAVAEMRIAGEPLAHGQETALKQTYSVSPVDLTKPFYLEQMLDWEISPIRRIDVLELGRHSHRTIVSGLKPNEDLKKLDPDPDADPNAASSGGTGGSATGGSPMGGMSMMGTGPMGGMPTPMGGMGGPTGAANEDATRVNKINRLRYMHVTPQCKHIPIGMRLVVDQAHFHDVLAAVANSRLRIQVCQVTLHHSPDVQKPGQGGPGIPGSPGSTGPGSPPMMGGSTPMRPGTPMGGPGSSPMGRPMVPPMMGSGSGAPPMGSGMGMPMPTPGGMRGPGGMAGMGGMAGFPNRPFMPMPGGGGGVGTFSDGGPGSTGTPGGVGGFPGGAGESMNIIQDNARLVEVSIYGIASLYERFPPKPKTTDATPGATTTPTTLK